MKNLWVVLALAACSSKKANDPPAPPPPVHADAGVTLPTPPSATDVASIITGCWAAQSRGDIKALGDCYAEAVTVESPGASFPPLTDKTKVLEAQAGMKHAFPDLEAKPVKIIVDHRDHYDAALALVRLTGTEATSKNPIGLLGAVYYELEHGKITHERDFFDARTISDQIAGGNPRSRAWNSDNTLPPDGDGDPDGLTTANGLALAFDKRDWITVGKLVDDNVIWSDRSEPSDWTKAQFLADRKGSVVAFPDVRIDVTSEWSSGAYVVEQGAIQGTNNGPLGASPATHKKISVPYLALYQVRDHKILRAWVFLQGNALVTQLGLDAK